MSSKLSSEIVSPNVRWKTFKKLISKDIQESIPPLNINSKIWNLPNHKANVHNTYFSSRAMLGRKDVPQLPPPVRTLSSIQVELEEIT